MKIFYECLILSSFLLIAGCAAEYNSVEFQKELNVKLADTLATKETVLLFYNLKKLARTNIIFGQQDATAYGVGWSGEPNRSDINDVIHSFPGVYGWDFSWLFIRQDSAIIENALSRLVKDAYYRGGVNIFCWHYGNPATGNSFYDTTAAVYKITPGGGFYLKYLRDLDRIADYVSHLKDSTGNPIPVIFRPYHEFDGSWFWWGKNFTSREEFIRLWRTTVTYLRDKRKVRNLLFAFSPDRMFKTKEEYLERYPGDDYVDILGTDIYYDFTPYGDGLEWINKKLKLLTEIAAEKNKIAAFTETGLEGIVNDKWWTQCLDKAIRGDSIKLAFVMVWRNANDQHHYAPYKNHPSAPDFAAFALDQKNIFGNLLPDLYGRPLADTDLEYIRKEKFIALMDVISGILILH